MQNIALAIVRQRDTLSQINRIGAWLYQVAVRQVLMYRRTSGRRRRFLDRLQVEPSQLAMDPIQPLQHLLAAENSAALHHALQQLPELDRQILMLKYSEDWSYRQLSEHLGVREDTIEYRLLKARKRLRQLLTTPGES